jgi:hypothetical protein
MVSHVHEAQRAKVSDESRERGEYGPGDQRLRQRGRGDAP